MQYFDAEGNPIDVPDVTELQEQLKQKEEELSKLRDKDLNFKRFRNLAEGEKEELKKQMSEKEKMLLSEIEDLRSERESEKTKLIEEAKELTLKNLVGDDADLRASVEAQASEWTTPLSSAKEVEDRYRKAYTLVKGVQPEPNPLFPLNVTPVYTAPKPKKEFAKTEEGQATFQSWFGTPPPSAQ